MGEEVKAVQLLKNITEGDSWEYKLQRRAWKSKHLLCYPLLRGLRDRRALFGKQKLFHNQSTELFAPCLGLHSTLYTPSGHTVLMVCCWVIFQNRRLLTSSVTKQMTQRKSWFDNCHWPRNKEYLSWIWRHDSITWEHTLPTVVATTIFKLHSLGMLGSRAAGQCCLLCIFSNNHIFCLDSF